MEFARTAMAGVVERTTKPVVGYLNFTDAMDPAELSVCVLLLWV